MLGLVDQRGRVDCFRARRGGSSLGSCGVDGEHGLLGASTVNIFHKGRNSVQIFVIISDGNLISALLGWRGLV